MIECRTCNGGELRKRKVYRMNAVVVLIGYIVLIPSFLGMATAAISCTNYITMMDDQDLQQQPPPDMTEEERQVYNQVYRTGRVVGVAAVGGAFVTIFLMSLVGDVAAS